MAQYADYARRRLIMNLLNIILFKKLFKHMREGAL